MTEIKTDRFYLRNFVLSDYKMMYKNWAGDDRATKYLSWKTHPSEDATLKRVADIVKSNGKCGINNWGIFKSDDDELIGEISAVNIYPEIKTIELGYVLGHDWWGEGYMSEALQAVIHFLLTEKRYNRVECHHDTRNEASGAVMKHSGMVYEGTLRQRGRNNQGICDEAIYSVLKSDLKD
ncbi:GNAT family N-acetyltransferase [Companilactobacillus mishanensis]|uniref:GNAT family N-acetyltransferase n=1 Tax=Companilactobacillus mishanensis TaxID=2486008 RepID=A0A5P0ZIH0_9LACO|nr:GNAT family N-acetyltransferase [Companilactobacillus mishanensis]MQS52870.1 GNAT family N-acetyltransferase [Companilactobacillus mishanensis]